MVTRCNCRDYLALANVLFGCTAVSGMSNLRITRIIEHLNETIDESYNSPCDDSKKCAANNHHSTRTLERRNVSQFAVQRGRCEK